jgi:hypothetical protein
VLLYGVVATLRPIFFGHSEWHGYNLPLNPDGSPDPLLPAPSCAQPTHVWVVMNNGSQVRQGEPVYLTGVVRSLSRVRFHFRDSSGTEVADHLTYFSDAGCVVHQEPFDTTSLPLGTVTVSATYQEWETNTEVTRDVIRSTSLPAAGGSTATSPATRGWSLPAGPSR